MFYNFPNQVEKRYRNQSIPTHFFRLHSFLRCQVLLIPPPPMCCQSISFTPPTQPRPEELLLEAQSEQAWSCLLALITRWEKGFYNYFYDVYSCNINYISCNYSCMQKGVCTIYGKYRPFVCLEIQIILFVMSTFT